MNEESNDKIIAGKPASYPLTAAPEQESKNIFQSLLDPRFVRGELRVMDKFPNADGILEITDIDRIPVGKIEVQLKTLPAKYYESPSYQCQRSFLAYCEVSPIPVFLVVVNREDRKVYWRHIDRDALLEASQRITGDSVSLPIPLENCIDGVNKDYIETWTKKAREAGHKAWNYDTLLDQKRSLEEKLREFNKRLISPSSLDLAILKEIHFFLDCYNYILDREFACVKQVLYPHYWKIGIGILKYESDSIRFVLYPVEFQKEQVLVKELREEDYKDIALEMSEGNILLLANRERDAIKNFPEPYAYDLLEDSILRIAGKYRFPIDDDFVAYEYLVSFIDRYHVYLDFERGLEAYSLKDLKFKLYSVLPMLVGSQRGFADWVTEYDHDIDSYYDWKSPALHHKKAIAESIEKIKEGVISKVKVTITSTAYNIDLIHYYINWLEAKGESYTRRQYQLGQLDETMYGVDIWKTWNKKVLWHNVQLFLQHFHKLYDYYIKTYFPLIRESLRIVPTDDTTVVYIFHFDDKHQYRPRMEVFHLRPTRPGQEALILSFLAEDQKNPIDRKAFFVDRKFDCYIDGEQYCIRQMHAQVLDFMFKLSPTYELINEKLSEQIRDFFREKTRAK